MESNPYESPKTEQPLKRLQVVKRSLGLATILLLTPPAMVVAVLTCCKAGNWFPSYEALVVFGVPFAILTCLMGLAAHEWRPRKDDPNSAKLHCIGVLVATPVCVGLATAVGYVLAALTYLAAGRPGGSLIPVAEWAMMAAFWLPPAATLLMMLLLAWRYR